MDTYPCVVVKDQEARLIGLALLRDGRYELLPMTDDEINVTLTKDQARALIEGWEIRETVGSETFGFDFSRAEDVLTSASEILRRALNT